MPVMLLVLMPVLILGAPTVTPRQKTLPGVANAVQKTAPNLFQLRDHVATWYCQRVRVSRERRDFHGSARQPRANRQATCQGTVPEDVRHLLHRGHKRPHAVANV